MQVTLRPTHRLSPTERADAEAALRQCVHCGMCNATCPTFQATGDELEGPRGRIYLVKAALEGAVPTPATLQHLDQCLGCRACETTCPSQVPYTRLADIGRRDIAATLASQGRQRPLAVRALRWMLREGLTRPRLFAAALGVGRAIAPVLPQSLRKQLPPRRAAGPRPTARHAQAVVLLEGCVQPALDPRINAAATRVLDSVGLHCAVAPGAGCCGALRYHLDDVEGGLAAMRRNIDAWTPLLEAGAQAIVSTASGCGQMLREYGHLLRDDPAYAERARRVSALARDVSQVLAPHKERLRQAAPAAPLKAAYHPPCSLQHGLRVRGVVEALLGTVGVQAATCADSHLCCGSAGTYSILQPAMARRLRDDKLAQLRAVSPDLILSANIGCQTHLQSGTDTPVRHWIELLDQRLHPQHSIPTTRGETA